MSKPNRLYFTFANQSLNIRVQPHRTDPDKVVLKSKHPEAADNLAVLTGMDLGITDRLQGSHNFICFANREAFAAACGAAILMIEEPKVEEHEDDEGGEEEEEDNDEYEIN